MKLARHLLVGAAFAALGIASHMSEAQTRRPKKNPKRVFTSLLNEPFSAKYLDAKQKLDVKNIDLKRGRDVFLHVSFPYMKCNGTDCVPCDRDPLQKMFGSLQELMRMHATPTQMKALRPELQSMEEKLKQLSGRPSLTRESVSLNAKNLSKANLQKNRNLRPSVSKPSKASTPKVRSDAPNPSLMMKSRKSGGRITLGCTAEPPLNLLAVEDCASCCKRPTSLRVCSCDCASSQ